MTSERDKASENPYEAPKGRHVARWVIITAIIVLGLAFIGILLVTTPFDITFHDISLELAP